MGKMEVKSEDYNRNKQTKKLAIPKAAKRCSHGHTQARVSFVSIACMKGNSMSPDLAEDMNQNGCNDNTFEAEHPTGHLSLPDLLTETLEANLPLQQMQTHQKENLLKPEMVCYRRGLLHGAFEKVTAT